MTKLVGSILGHPVSKFRRVPDNSLTIPDCLLGVEFEFEGVRAAATTEAAAFLGLWALKDDGSLRNAGKEFVFKEPLFGVDATTAITQLVELATKHKFSCNLRTGLHVHVDCRDMTTDSLRSMCLAYAIAEPFIYKWIGDNREESNFCVPWYYSEEAISAAAKIIRSLSDEESIDKSGDASKVAAMGYQRYAGFNMNSLDRFGSVEFRHMQTCLNLKRILAWINMTLHLKKIGSSMGAENLYRQLIKGTPSTVLHYAVGAAADEVMERCAGRTKDLLETGRENMVNLYGLTTVSGNPYGRYSKNLEKFKGPNRGIQRFKAKRTKQAAPPPPQPAPVIEEHGQIGGIQEFRFMNMPNGWRLGNDNVRRADQAFAEQDLGLQIERDVAEARARMQQAALRAIINPMAPADAPPRPRPNRPANRR